METILINPETGEVLNEDSSDEEIAEAMIAVQREKKRLIDLETLFRKHIEDRVTESDPNFGEKYIKIEYAVLREWGVRDPKAVKNLKDIDKEIEELSDKMRPLEKDRKQIFDAFKVDIGIKGHQLRIKYPNII